MIKNLNKNDVRKISVYMDPDHKWFIEEIAHRRRDSQKRVLFDIIQHYWDTEVPYIEKPEESCHE